MTTPTREEIDLAAAAAGYKIWWKEGSCKGGAYEAPFFIDTDEPWRPWENDGDCIRLAINLSLHHDGLRILLPDQDDPSAVVRDWTCELHVIDQAQGGDYAASLRRAVFAAAVALGRKATNGQPNS